ncbi:MAG: hypothetical protein MI924_26595 [Chloroflexales bacterium]|nr:hypothetical protein [Chloroflexales bacterium]
MFAAAVATALAAVVDVVGDALVGALFVVGVFAPAEDAFVAGVGSWAVFPPQAVNKAIMSPIDRMCGKLFIILPFDQHSFIPSVRSHRWVGYRQKSKL